MRYRKTKSGYCYKEYSNGKRVRISKLAYQKAKKVKKGGKRRGRHKGRKRRTQLTIKQFLDGLKKIPLDIPLEDKVRAYFQPAWDNFYYLSSHGAEVRKRSSIVLKENEFVIMNCVPACITWEVAEVLAVAALGHEEKHTIIAKLFRDVRNLWCLYKPHGLVPDLNIQAWHRRKNHEKKVRWGLFEIPLTFHFSKKRKKSFYRAILKKRPLTTNLQVSDIEYDRPYVDITSDHVRYPYGKTITLKSIIKGLRKKYKSEGFILFVAACRSEATEEFGPTPSY
jgi:hypothetical protein